MAVAQSPDGLAGSVLRVGSKKPKVIARPRRAVIGHGASSAFHGRHSKHRSGFCRRLRATATVRSRSDGGGTEHACIAEERKSDGRCIVRMQLLPVIGSWSPTRSWAAASNRWAQAQIVAVIRPRSEGRSMRLPLIAKTSVAVATGMCGPRLRIVARERVSGKPDAPSQERPHGPEVAGTGE